MPANNVTPISARSVGDKPLLPGATTPNRWAQQDGHNKQFRKLHNQSLVTVRGNAR
ncbi:MAG: hypothetical protein PsegKO_16810 [Pseudohongiellaceae bacterium]